MFLGPPKSEISENSSEIAFKIYHHGSFDYKSILIMLFQKKSGSRGSQILKSPKVLDRLLVNFWRKFHVQIFWNSQIYRFNNDKFNMVLHRKRKIGLKKKSAFGAITQSRVIAFNPFIPIGKIRGNHLKKLGPYI